MKLPNFLFNGPLNALRSEMGAPLSNSFKAQGVVKLIDLPMVEVLRTAGLEVNFEDVKRLKDGTLGYKGHRVLLYIRDVQSYGDRATLPKFHVAYCKTLESMRAANRFQRYVVANRDDGLFEVNLLHEARQKRPVALAVCQFCLGMLGWNGFPQGGSSTERAQHVKAFSLADFFKRYSSDLVSIRPDHTSNTAPINEYTADWPDVSERVKHQRNYGCEGCGRRLTLRLGRYLHVHHSNGLKYDNSDGNLVVLCIRCHAEQPLHGHLKALQDYHDFLSLQL